MAAALLAEPAAPGFSFENCKRNAFLAKDGFKPPRMTKTGTTICGIIFKDGVVLGADTRATAGSIVADKNCAKIHYISENMYCCGAGTAADTENVTNMISSQVALHALNTGRKPRHATATTLIKQYLFRYQGHISAALILGGVDVTGPHLCAIHPHGSTSPVPYVTMGSGSLAAMSVFEDRFRPDMPLEEAKQLVRDAIEAGITNDLGSGSNVDLCVITASGVDYLRNHDTSIAAKGVRQGSYRYKRGTTAIKTSEVKKIETEIVSEVVEAMDTA